MISKATTVLLAAAVLLNACGSSGPQRPQPKAMDFAVAADSILNIALRQTQWGIEIWDQARNQSLYSHDADRHFIPASNTKLVVTATAMGLLGPEWRYQTPVGVVPGATDSVVRALVVKGSGDPSMSARFYGNDLAVLDSFADSLAARGIRRINGDVVVDARIFAPQRVHPDWETGDLPWYYAAPTASFAVAEAAVRMIVTANDVQFVGLPPGPTVVRRVQTDTVGARSNIDVQYEAWPDSLLLTGSIAPSRADSSWIALPDPELYAGRALVEALRRKSITVAGNVRVLRDSVELAALGAQRPLFVWQSPPMKEIVAGLLRPSQNWIAEQLLKTLGAVKGTEGSWREGLQVERRYLIDVAHIDSMAFSLADGSGLSAHNVVSPHAFVMLLEHVRRSSWSQFYYDALPKPGRQPYNANIGAGTLANRLPGLETRLAAKTGTIANVNSLSGYLTAADGRQVTFSILTNGSGRSSGDVRRAIDLIVQALAREKNWD